MREDQAWILVCVLCAAVVREGLMLLFGVWLFYYLVNLYKCSPVHNYFFPIYELCYSNVICDCLGSNAIL